MAIQPVPPPLGQLVSRPQGVTPARPAAEAPATTESTAPQQTAQTEQTSSALSVREQVDRAMNEVRQALGPVARNLQFSIDDETGRTVIKVVDATTKEVIRQMPSEELLAITRSLDKFSGLFVKQKV
ncbi:flagellar protein FlaG [Uliginosibacterium sp. H1]|uniref:flagellar protein FlaG n=1 Tax=Uliginosibacterium sp. H1 TaxID=3114757 RepID=UPI002E18DB85|nr:flagellar protein FlaG [Uliginosibacterium sp. H1]